MNEKADCQITGSLGQTLGSSAGPDIESAISATVAACGEAEGLTLLLLQKHLIWLMKLQKRYLKKSIHGLSEYGPFTGPLK